VVLEQTVLPEHHAQLPLVLLVVVHCHLRCVVGSRLSSLVGAVVVLMLLPVPRQRLVVLRQAPRSPLPVCLYSYWLVDLEVVELDMELRLLLVAPLVFIGVVRLVVMAAIHLVLLQAQTPAEVVDRVVAYALSMPT
jgi:hypothetical protein